MPKDHKFPRTPVPARRHTTASITRRMLAFKADAQTLEHLWDVMRKHCAGKETTYTSLTVNKKTRGVKVEHRYDTMRQLRDARNGPKVLRDYHLSAHSGWGTDKRSIRLSSDHGHPATLTATGPDEAWCRDALAAVETSLRHSACWHAPIHRIPEWALFAAMAALLGIMLISGLTATPERFPSPIWLAANIGLYTAIGLTLFRARCFPAADFVVDRPPPSVVPFNKAPESDGGASAGDTRAKQES